MTGSKAKMSKKPKAMRVSSQEKNTYGVYACEHSHRGHVSKQSKNRLLKNLLKTLP